MGRIRVRAGRARLADASPCEQCPISRQRCAHRGGAVSFHFRVAARFIGQCSRPNHPPTIPPTHAQTRCERAAARRSTTPQKPPLTNTYCGLSIPQNSISSVYRILSRAVFYVFFWVALRHLFVCKYRVNLILDQCNKLCEKHVPE